MDIRVSGHQLDVGTSLTSHIEATIEALTEKYGIRSTGANITLTPGPRDSGFTCDILVQLTQGLVVKAGARSNTNAQTAFDGAIEKIDKQFRRYKRRLDDHHKANGGARDVAFQAEYRVLRPQEDEEAADNPLVVAETRVDIPDASVSDAVMMLDLRDTSALMFKNRSEEHTSELQSLMRISYAVFCLK